MASSLRLHPHDHITRIELVGENNLPRLDTSLLSALERALTELFADPACHALVLHGNETCFAAGADLDQVSALDGVEAFDFARRGQLLFERIAHGPKPVVAAISGYCLGGAWDLALACHARLATPDAVFRHPGPTIGILTGWGGTQRVPRITGRAHALEILLTGQTVPAPRALQLRLVDELIEWKNLLPRALERAQALADSFQP